MILQFTSNWILVLISVAQIWVESLEISLFNGKWKLVSLGSVFVSLQPHPGWLATAMDCTLQAAFFSLCSVQCTQWHQTAEWTHLKEVEMKITYCKKYFFFKDFLWTFYFFSVEEAVFYLSSHFISCQSHKDSQRRRLVSHTGGK